MRACFTCRITKHFVKGKRGKRKKIPARAAFSRRFAIAQWKKPIFPVTRENEKKKKKKKKKKERENSIHRRSIS